MTNSSPTAAPDAAQDSRPEAHPVLERAAPTVGHGGSTTAARTGRRARGTRRTPRPRRTRSAAPAPRRRRSRRSISSISSLGHRVAAVAVVVDGRPRRRPGRAEGVVEVAVLADVVQLLHDRGALGVHGVGDPPGSRRDDGVVAVPEVAAGEHGGRVHRHGLDDDHRRPAAGPLAVVAEVTSAGSPPSVMFAVCAPKTMRFRSVRWRSCSGSREVREALVHGTNVLLVPRPPIQVCRAVCDDPAMSDERLARIYSSRDADELAARYDEWAAEYDADLAELRVHRPRRRCRALPPLGGWRGRGARRRMRHRLDRPEVARTRSRAADRLRPVAGDARSRSSARCVRRTGAGLAPRSVAVPGRCVRRGGVRRSLHVRSRRTVGVVAARRAGALRWPRHDDLSRQM